jgi:hypothetical protein
MNSMRAIPGTKRERSVRKSHSVELSALTEALRRAWSADTSSDPAGWVESNAALGQCAVTALVVQDYLGGNLLRCRVGTVSHYWNLLPSGEEIDLTRHQFGASFESTDMEERTRDYVLSFEDTRRRYDALRVRVDRVLGKRDS